MAEGHNSRPTTRLENEQNTRPQFQKGLAIIMIACRHVAGHPLKASRVRMGNLTGLCGVAKRLRHDQG